MDPGTCRDVLGGPGPHGDVLDGQGTSLVALGLLGMFCVVLSLMGRWRMAQGPGGTLWLGTHPHPQTFWVAWDVLDGLGDIVGGPGPGGDVPVVPGGISRMDQECP